MADTERAKKLRAALIGKRFGRLLVTREAGFNRFQQALMEARCDCGETAIVPAHGLKAGFNRSCGCLRSEVAAKVARKTGRANRGKKKN